MQSEHEAVGRRPRWLPGGPMYPVGLSLAGFLGVLVAILLLVDVNLSFDSSHKESSQTVGSASGTLRPIGDQLQVYLADGARLPGLHEALIAAIKENELPFANVAFVTDLPAKAQENPVLVIRVLQDGGFWLPAVASRQMKVRFYYAQGWSVDREAVLNPGGDTRTVSVNGGHDVCEGSCARGERDLTLGARSVGIVSLPHMRAYVAKELASEAVLLVKGGLPANLDPEKWAGRAGDLAREQEPKEAGKWSTLQWIPGCLGGVLVVGDVGHDGKWSMIYYDATQDALTEKLTQAEVAARAEAKLGLSGVQIFGSPGFGGTDQGFSLFMATMGHGSITATIAPGQCGLSGLEFTRR